MGSVAAGRMAAARRTLFEDARLVALKCTHAVGTALAECTAAEHGWEEEEPVQALPPPE